MERFVVSARKYRPDTFEGLIGQENIATTLKNSVLKGQLAHAYLFCGPRGVGKTSTARIFAKTINCQNPGTEMEPCGKCESCISFAQGRSYSIHELDAASNNSVEDIRQLNDLVRIPPQIGKYSVYIIDEVHMLSQSAFNAFLKTLEEPPAHAIFILATTEKHKILPTILSRCQTYDFNRISVENIVKNLTSIAQKENIDIQPDALHIIAQKADGAMRDALTIFDQAIAFCGTTITYESIISNLNVLDYDYYLTLTDNMLSGDYAKVLLTFDQILSKGFNALHFIIGLSNHFRDLLVCKDKTTIQLLELAPTVKDKYKEQSQNCSLQFLYDALNITSACEAGYKNSGNQRLHIEIALFRLCRVNTEATWHSTEQKAEKPTTEKQPVDKHNEEAQPTEAKPATTQKATTQETTPTTQQTKVKPNNAPQSISIKELLKNAGNNGKNKNQATTAIIGNDTLLPEKLAEVWKLMAEKEKSYPRLATTIVQTEPKILENNVIHFPVKNELQKNWIEKNCKARLVEFLKVNLNNKEVTLQIEVTPDDDPGENKMYMPQEKAKFITDTYPEVKELQKDLKLELK
ncbi:MAG: DNA polymerase III subunit gamma/tau [Bacteroidales bacterium]|nr:DNA polymerase III subunit gamma/tau [Bacteroidales bacterium]